MQQRFDNFVTFVESEVPNSPIVFLLKQLNLETFLAGMIKMVNEHPPCTHDEITNLCGHHAASAVLARLHLEPAAFSPASLAKFTRYCEYFLEQIQS